MTEPEIFFSIKTLVKLILHFADVTDQRSRASVVCKFQCPMFNDSLNAKYSL